MMPRPVNRLWLWGPVVLHLIAIFLISSLHDPSLPGGVSDKSGHFAGYFVLGALVLRALAGGRLAGVTWRAGLGAIALSSLYGATDELHQYFVPTRSADILDWRADTLGAATAVLACLAVAAIVSRRRGAARGEPLTR